MERVDFDHYLMSGINRKRVNGVNKEKIGSGFYYRDGKTGYFRSEMEFPKKYMGKVRKIKKTRIIIKRRLKYLN